MGETIFNFPLKRRRLGKRIVMRRQILRAQTRSWALCNTSTAFLSGSRYWEVRQVRCVVVRARLLRDVLYFLVITEVPEAAATLFQKLLSPRLSFQVRVRFQPLLRIQP